jgi:cytochrome c553
MTPRCFRLASVKTLAACVALLPLLPLLACAADGESAGDASRGKSVASSCRSCHGAQGEGNLAAGVPRLGGQTAHYLAAELHDYQTGVREHPIMSAIAKTLTDTQRLDVAAYFAGLSPPRSMTAEVLDTKVLARGALLAGHGDEAKQIQSCGNCHGPEGRGEPLAAPYLAGQSKTYLAATLAAWKNGQRKNGAALMAPIASRLDDTDIEAVATYFSSLQAPAP